VHTNDHGRRSAFAPDLLDDLHGGAMSLAQTGDLFATDQTQQTGFSQRPQRDPRKDAGAVYLFRLGRYDRLDDSLDLHRPCWCSCHRYRSPVRL
jgi:hypothetical protein